MNSILNCIAIDDEPLALSIIQKHAAKVPFLNLQATFESGTEGLTYLQENKADVLFLDINMPDINGIELAAMLAPSIKVVFTTAYAEYAVNGFELAATDYLLKPIGFARFLQACTRVQQQTHNASRLQATANDHIFVKDGYDMIRINFEDLLYAQADDNYVVFHQYDKKTLARMTLKETLKLLPGDQFIQVHKSYVEAISKIEKIERHQLIVGGAAVPVSPTYRQTMLESIG